jgi:hypothetical protein
MVLGRRRQKTPPQSTEEGVDSDENKSFCDDDASEAPSMHRGGTSWDDEDAQENAFFEKSVKVESHQAVVKVLEHGNTQMLILEVSSLCTFLSFVQAQLKL